MSTIAAYKFTPRPVPTVPALWDAEAKRFTPQLLSGEVASGGLYLHDYLNAITLAVEAGVVEQNGWLAQLFADAAGFDAFCEQLQGYDECFRITDQWWQALHALVEGVDEEGFVTSAEIADRLREYAEETGQL